MMRKDILRELSGWVSFILGGILFMVAVLYSVNPTLPSNLGEGREYCIDIPNADISKITTQKITNMSDIFDTLIPLLKEDVAENRLQISKEAKEICVVRHIDPDTNLQYFEGAEGKYYRFAARFTMSDKINITYSIR